MKKNMLFPYTKLSATMLIMMSSMTNAADIQIGGTIEVEAVYSSPESDISVATVELSATSNINEQLSAELIALYEEDETDLEIDVATLNYQISDSPLSLTAGQFYVPFGAYETALVSDPLTLEIGEARETSLMLNFGNESLSSSLYVFNGDIKKNGKNSINNWGANLVYSTEILEFGVSYINDLGDSDALQELLTDDSINDYTDGASAYIKATVGEFTIIAEHTTALNAFSSEALAGIEPSASNFEVNYETQIAGKEAVLALARQTSDDALVLELPETRTLIGLSVDLDENLGLSAEYSRDEDYSIAAGGSDESTDNFVIQLAASF